MLDSAVLPLYKPLPPTTEPDHIRQHGTTVEQKVKIEKDSWVRRVKSFERGLEE